MKTAFAILITFPLLCPGPGCQSFSQEKMHVVAEDDCGSDGKQRHLISGLNWTFSEEEIPYSSIPKNSSLRSVSFGETIHYRFRGLEHGARYQLRVSYLTDKNSRVELCAIDGQIVGDTIRLIPSRPSIRVYDIPRLAYDDGQIDVVFSLLSGPNAVVSSLELLSDDPVLQTVLDIAMTSDFAGTVSGTIADENSGKPVAGARVEASVGAFPLVQTLTGDAGKFSLRIPEEWRKSGEEACRVHVSYGDIAGEKRIALYEVFPERNPLASAPDTVQGVRRCRISLNGTWEFTLKPTDGFWKKDGPTEKWAPILVPGECRMQGFAVEHDREFAYRRVVAIPADFRNRRIFVRFHGVYSFARVWVNGKYVRSHQGGFTSWDCEITDLVKPGEDAVLTLGVTDRIDDISFGSGYAKHPVGGILRGVELLALPKDYVRQLYVETELNSTYKDALLRIDAALSSPIEGRILIRLIDPAGKSVPISPSSVAFSPGTRSASARISLRSPFLWDAEHPRLYTLEARFVTNGRTREVIRQRIGFREVKVAGSQLLVNGRPVKLRGACRHDIHPVLGRSTTPEQDRQDAILAKEANFNFIRTSHYPPSQDFLEYCDEMGLYVEEETAVCFVGTFRGGVYRATGSTQNDDRYTERYLSQLAEMIDRDRNHPGVIIWSIGNENSYGTNFQKEYAFVKHLDSSRPVMFSFPHTVPEGVSCYDISSNHYPSFDRCLHLAEGEGAFPVLGDEWMHVACYCIQDLKADPNIRNFWGESIKRAWENNFDSDKSIGGAIWGMVDEVFLLPDSCDGYGPWGILDVWRRKKPEFWHTKKAYSPARLLTTRIEGEPAGRVLSLPLHNRFDHTNLQEVRILCRSGSTSEVVSSPAIPPHGRGILQLPGKFDRGRPIHLQFIDAAGRLIDEELLTYTPKLSPDPRPQQRLHVDVTADSIVARGATFTVTFDRRSGLIRSGTYEGVRIIEGGPFIRLVVPGRRLSWDVDSLRDVTGSSWHLDSMTIRSSDTSLVLSLAGKAADFRARISMEVRGSGEITTSYELEDPPQECQEAGVRFLLSSTLDKLSWNRQALWSLYPDNHIGRPEGEAAKTEAGAAGEQYGLRPEQPWSRDTKDFFLFKADKGIPPGGLPISHDFRAMKENLTSYTLWNQESRRGLRVESDGGLAARADVRPDGSLHLFVNTHWTYMNLNWGNYERPAKMQQGRQGTVKIRFWKSP